MLNWANRFNIFILLDSHSYKDCYSNYDWLLAANAADSFTATRDVLPSLSQFLLQQNDWLFGHVSYDLKNHIEPLQSAHPDLLGFPDVFFFQPDVLILPTEEGVEISCLQSDPAAVFEAIINTPPQHDTVEAATVPIRQKIEKETYLQIIDQLRKHILRGDCYEINFCQEFFAEHAHIDPLMLYKKLSEISPTPFGGFYKLEDRYLLCASPERFLQKKAGHIIAQPIKGTIRRDLADAAADETLKATLASSQKDKSENVMIVDLMRNDLSKICQEGSVVVDELYGIYSFPQVHQMISTIKGLLKEDVDFATVLQACFPMGSMTGAPKRRVMELTEQYEQSRRGIYAGSIGYITPQKDFDFNVVIRSIMYNAQNHYLSYQVGGGITFYSSPENEYEECLLKAAAIKKVLQ